MELDLLARRVVDGIVVPVKTPLDVVNACCATVETVNKSNNLKLNGPQKQNAAVDVLKYVIPALLDAKLIDTRMKETLDALMAKEDEIRNTINSVISIWNQFKRTACYKKLFPCCV